MLTCTTREPDQFAGSIHEQEANEPPACAYCGNEVSEEGDYCSDLCKETRERLDAEGSRITAESVGAIDMLESVRASRRRDHRESRSFPRNVRAAGIMAHAVHHYANGMYTRESKRSQQLLSTIARLGAAQESK